MKRIVYIFIILSFLAHMGVQAQNAGPAAITFDNVQTKKVGNNLVMNFTVNLNNLKIGLQHMIILTPVLQSNDQHIFFNFNPVVITGRKRMKALEREMDLSGFQFPQEPTVIFRRHNNQPEFIPMELSLPYEPWMRNASLLVNENLSGCANCEIADNVFGLSPRVLPPVVAPTFELSYVTPPAEPVKQRNETHSAYLNFEVGKSVLLRDFKNNAAVLSEVNKIVNEVRNDKDLKFTEFNVVGYASPEGNFNFNMKLSEARAKAFVAYMKDKENMDPSMMKVSWMGEDWSGLRKEISESSLADRSQILDILDIPDIAQRKSKLHALNGGRTYKMLLADYYPALRRIDYTLSYIARPFDVNEAKTVIKNKPQYLSLNEMFVVANSYPKGSPEFKEVFDIAVRMYPTDPIAQLNTGALEVETGALDAAIARLQSINLPEAWNDLGVAYVKKQDYQKAMDYFTKASNAGLKAATQNKIWLTEWLAEQ